MEVEDVLLIIFVIIGLVALIVYSYKVYNKSKPKEEPMSSRNDSTMEQRHRELQQAMAQQAAAARRDLGRMNRPINTLGGSNSLAQASTASSVWISDSDSVSTWSTVSNRNPYTIADFGPPPRRLEKYGEMYGIEIRESSITDCIKMGSMDLPMKMLPEFIEMLCRIEEKLHKEGKT